MKLDLVERIAEETIALSFISGILAGVLACIYDVEYACDMFFYTMMGTAFVGIILDLIIFTVMSVIFAISTMGKED